MVKDIVPILEDSTFSIGTEITYPETRDLSRFHLYIVTGVNICLINCSNSPSHSKGMVRSFIFHSFNLFSNS